MAVASGGKFVMLEQERKVGKGRWVQSVVPSFFYLDQNVADHKSNFCCSGPFQWKKVKLNFDPLSDSSPNSVS